ncbi:MAG: GNAT family N-acetyltransferase, partial [Alphaproteobacteria bacterium]|nr:GNAT family N-acetyltransferase [Alphaproteobacteria bacterium]
DKLGFEAVVPGTINARALNQTVNATRMRLTRARWQERRRYRLKTPRLLIRELHASDWRALQAIGGDPAVARMMVSVPSPWPDTHVKTWIEKSLYRGRPGFRPAVCLKDGTLIGTLGLGKSPRDAELGCAYFIAPKHAGKGYATEALGAFLADTMARFDIATLAADHFADNPTSGRVLQKLGFRRIGTGQGHSAARLEPAPNILYRLIRSDLKVSR